MNSNSIKRLNRKKGGHTPPSGLKSSKAKEPNTRKKGKEKPAKIDGLSAHDIKKIRAAIRQVWHRSHVRKLCVNRCIGAGGFSYCEKCKKRAPKIFIDHIIKVGDVDGGFIERLFTPSKNLQGLCKKCHDAKTKEERADAKLKKDLGLKDV